MLTRKCAFAQQSSHYMHKIALITAPKPNVLHCGLKVITWQKTFRPPRSLACRAARSPPAITAAAVDADAQAAILQSFLGWLVANGTEGIGTAASKIGLYNGENGERGILCTAPIKKSELIARLPLRLAITDYPEDEESNELVYAGAPWSVRLACKILRLKAQGQASPFYPYIQALPASVPTPLITFTWEDIDEMGYEPMRGKFDTATFLTKAYDSLSTEATGGATREEFLWALSVVHSR